MARVRGSTIVPMGKTEILNIPVNQPHKLFTKDDQIKKQYQRLVSRWHPDRAGGDDAVMSHIKDIYEAAKELINKGLWHIGKYGMHTFELGTMHIGDRDVTYVIDNEYTDLVQNAKRTITNFRYADNKMRTEVIRYLPNWLHNQALGNNTKITLEKPEEYLNLRDVLNHFGGAMPPRHVAWIISRLYNLRCYLHWAGITHNDISPDNYYISPKGHIGILLGGWWYACRRHTKMAALPQRTINYIPAEALASGVASRRTDGELIKATGRELLGDIQGSKLIYGEAPMALINWLRSPATVDPLKEYSTWYKVLEDSFGPRQFVKLELTARDLYG